MSDTEELLHVDPATITVGANVRTDLRPDAKEFAKSIKERGVLETITAYRDADGTLVCIRGQRRTVVATEVGRPTVPVRVVPEPESADRIGDQLVENLHRAEMREHEIVSGVEQLALLGVSAAQIARRTAIKRPTVNAALAVANGKDARSRVESGDLTLQEAALFAEFEGDDDALARLERCREHNWPLEHEAQRLRDEAAEAAEYDAEVERYRAEGLPVLSRDEAEDADGALPLADMRTPDGQEVPAEDWAQVPGTAVMLVEDWTYPDGSEDEVKVYTPTWIVTDTEASGLVHASQVRHLQAVQADDQDGDDADPEQARAAAEAAAEAEAKAEAEAEAKREERRRVIANNKAWDSAVTVRHEWLTAFLARKSVPKGAEALIREAVLTGSHDLKTAMERRHPLLSRLLGFEGGNDYWGARAKVGELATKQSTPKAATLTTLGAVVVAWEDATTRFTWRNPSAWDARVLGALVEWGYRPSDVERLVLGEEPEQHDQHDQAEAATDEAEVDAEISEAAMTGPDEDADADQEPDERPSDATGSAA